MTLTVTIPEDPPFYSLYADGRFMYKVFDKALNATLLSYPENQIVILYYTYPTHREACVIRNTASGRSLLPGLSARVSLIFSVSASRVDKLRRAAGFLKKRASASLDFSDDFYIRLYFIIRRSGKLSYPALESLITKELRHDNPD